MKKYNIDEAKRGRKALHKTRDIDAEFVRQNYGKTSNDFITTILDSNDIEYDYN